MPDDAAPAQGQRVPPDASHPAREPRAGLWRRLRRFVTSLWRTERSRLIAMQRMAAERSAWPITVVRPTGVLQWVNPAFSQLCGMPAEDCVGRALGGLMGLAESDSAGLARLQACLLAQGQERLSVTGSRPNGRPMHLLVEVRPGLSRGGLILQWLDQSEHVETSQQLQATLQELRRERERLGQILDGTQVGAWEVNLITGEARMDKAWAAMFGFDPARVASWSRLEARSWMHPDDLGITNTQITEHVSGLRAGVDFEHRVRHQAGHWMWVHSRGKIATWSPDGRPEWLSGSHMDISARKQQEQALAQQREHLRRVLASLPGVVFEFEMSAPRRIKMLFLSDALKSMFGIAPQDALDDPRLLFARVPEEDMQSLYAAIAVSSANRQLLEHEYRIVAGNTVRWLGVHAKPAQREDGQVHWQGMLFDVTRRHELADQLAQARNAAEAANRAKSAFLATMSHEIRSPMNGVLGMTDVLMSADTPQDRADAVQTIRDSAGALLTLIDDILDFSKIEAGRLELERVSFNPGLLTEAVAESLASSAAARQVAVRLTLAPNLPGTVWGDPTRFRQILFNLISNAIKFSRPHAADFGKVHIRLMRADAPASGLVLRVQDWGIGIPAETLPHLFQPFSQADASTTRRFGGTGLGLAIVQRLVTAMDGQIDVQSAEGQGTCMDVSLPLEVDASPAIRPDHDLSGVSCLIVCDDPCQAAEWQSLLCAAGAEVHGTTRLDLAAIQAISVQRPEQPWVVLLPYAQTLPELGPLKSLRRQSGRDLRFLCLALNGQPQALRFLEADVATVRTMRRQALWRAVATLAGQASPEVPVRADARFNLAPAPAPLSRSGARDAGRLVLVVEDLAVNQKVAVHQLALLGLVADIAGDGEQGLALWRNETYALVLTDLHMPKMDGYTWVAQLRLEEAETQRPRTPVLAWTANALRGEAHRAREAGMDDYLTKPIALDTLRATLQRWLPEPATAATARLQASDTSASPSPAAGRPASPTEPTLDLTVLQRLVGDDQAVLNEFLDDFRSALTTLSAELRAAFLTADLSQVGAVAHKLKSAAKAVGALPLAKLCERLCQMPGHVTVSPHEDPLLQQARIDFECQVDALEQALQATSEGVSA